MIEVDETKLICALYELIACTDIFNTDNIGTIPIEIVHNIKTVLTNIGAYNKDNILALDDRIISIVRDSYNTSVNTWMEGNVKKEI